MDDDSFCWKSNSQMIRVKKILKKESVRMRKGLSRTRRETLPFSPKIVYLCWTHHILREDGNEVHILKEDGQWYLFAQKCCTEPELQLLKCDKCQARPEYLHRQDEPERWLSRSIENQYRLSFLQEICTIELTKEEKAELVKRVRIVRLHTHHHHRKKHKPRFCF